VEALQHKIKFKTKDFSQKGRMVTYEQKKQIEKKILVPFRRKNEGHGVIPSKYVVFSVWNQEQKNSSTAS
jgi:hypothetical protein